MRYASWYSIPPSAVDVSIAGSSALIRSASSSFGGRVPNSPTAQYAVAPSAANHGWYGELRSSVARKAISLMLSGYAFINRLRERDSSKTSGSS